MASAEVYDSYFRRADLDRDGRISGSEAVGFFQGAGLPQVTLAKIWQFADQSRAGFLSRQEFFNALKLVTVAQTGRELTPELVKAALTGPAAAQIPPPRISTPTPPSSNFGQTPRAQTPQVTAPQGNYGRQFSTQVGNTQQSGPQTGYSAPPTQQFSSQGGNIPQISQPQNRFSSVGSRPQGDSTMPQPPRPGLPSAGPGVMQARPSLGGLFGADSSWQASKTSSFPSGTQIASSNSFVGSGLQSAPAPGLPRPTAPGNILFTAASLPSAPSAPGFQAAGNGGLKPGSGSFSSVDLYGAAPPTRPTGAGPPPSKMDPVGQKAVVPTTVPTSTNLSKPSGGLQTPSSTSLTADIGSLYNVRPLSGPGLTPPWPRMTPNDVQRYTRVFSKVDTDHDGKITGGQARELFLSWQLPREVLKQVWNLSDQDGDSMLSVREFCTALYLMERFREGRPLPPRLPPGIHLDDPRGPDGQMPTTQRPSYGGPNWQQAQGNIQQLAPGSGPGPGPVRPTLLTTPAGQKHLQSLTSAGRGALEASAQAALDPQAAFGEFNFVYQRKQPEKEAPNSMPRVLENSATKVGELDKNLMDHRQKSEYYRTKLQEIVLFKSRCDNKLAEITERAAADRREVDSLAKKFDEKFKSAAEVNAQLAVEEANLRDVQEKKVELYDALLKMDHGGNPNALLQNRADRIATDLDKLRKALRDRAELLGVEVKQKIPKEMPFGWQPSIQEKATEWNADWDKFDDEGFSVVQEYMDETAEAPTSTTSPPEPSAAASWATKGGSALEDVFSSPDTDVIKGDEQKEDLPISEAPPVDIASEDVETVSKRNGTATLVDDVPTSKSHSDGKSTLPTAVSASKLGERYANVGDSQEFGSDLFNNTTAASSPTNSSDLGRGSFTPDQFVGIGSSWKSGSNEDSADSGPRTSWGLQNNSLSTQNSLDVTNSRGATRLRKSTGSFGTGESFDPGSPRGSSIDGTSSPARASEWNGNRHSNDFESFRSFGSPAASKDSNKMSSFFGGNLSTRAAPASSLFGGSPGASKRDDGFNSSFLRFDSFGPGSPVAPPRASAAGEDRSGNFLNRFDSFSSVQTDGGARSSGFHSDDESDLFAATGPFSAKTPQASDRWKAF